MLYGTNNLNFAGWGLPHRFGSFLCPSLAVFCLVFSSLCLSATAPDAKSSLEQLDPLELLITAPTKDTQGLSNPAQTSVEFIRRGGKISNPTERQIVSQNLSFEPLTKDEKDFLAADKTARAAVPANFAAQLDGTLPQNDLFLTAAPGTDVTRRLWKARIDAPKRDEESKTKNELRQLIERLRSVVIKSQQKSPRPSPVAEVVPATEPNDSNDAAEPPLQLTKEQPELQQTSSLSYKPVSPKTLQMLNNLAKDPNQVKNPFELAEVLFQSGFPKQAIPFYQQALNRCTPDPNDHSQNRAWIMFQLGNCLRTENPQAAIEIYKQLITEFPDSTWTELAKAREKLITWYQQDQPNTFTGKIDF